MANETILVVEDEGTAILRLQKLLKQWDYTPLAATSGEEALQLAAAVSPDLVLMDIRLSGQIDGITTAAQLQKRFDIPVIYLTAYADEELLEQAGQTEPYGYLVKPIQELELQAMLKMALTKYKVDKQLQESEERYRTVSEMMSDYVYALQVGPDGGLTMEWMTEGYTQLTGYDNQEVPLEQTLTTFIHPDDQSLVWQHLQTSLSNQSSTIESRVITKQGEVRWVRDHLKPIWDTEQGRVIRIIGAAQDVTESRQAAEALQESEQKFRSVIQQSGDGIILADHEGKIIEWNQGAEQILGLKQADVLGRSLADIQFQIALEEKKSPALYDKLQMIFQELLEKQDAPWLYQLQEGTIQRPNGEHRQIQSMVFPVQTGQSFMIGSIVRDMTEYKQIMEAYQALVDYSLQGLSILQDERLVFANQALARILGYSIQELQAMSGVEIHRLMHFKEQTVLAQPRQIPPPANELLPAHYEVRAKRKDGTECWLEHFISPIQYRGRPAIQVASIDITERKQAEISLQHYAERLKSLHEIDQDILNAQSPQIIAQTALAHLQSLIPYLRASILEFPPEAEQGRLLAGLERDKTGLENGLKAPARAPKTELLKQNQPRLVHDLLAVSPLSPWEQTLLAAGVRSYAHIPLVIQGELIGLLNLEADQPHIFTADSLEIATEVAASLAIAVRQARLYQQTHRDAQTRAVLLNEVNHRVKNNLSNIIGLLYVERRYALRNQMENSYLQMIEDLIHRLEGLATVHQMLSVSEWSPLPLSELTGQIIDSALQALPTDRRLSFKVSSPPIHVSPKQANSLAMIINELATNTLKHACVTADQAVHITVQIIQEDDQVRFEFRDDGPGFKEAVLRGEQQSVGMYLLQNIISYDLQGEVSFHNDQGAVITINFPLKKP